HRRGCDPAQRSWIQRYRPLCDLAVGDLREPGLRAIPRVAPRVETVSFTGHALDPRRGRMPVSRPECLVAALLLALFSCSREESERRPWNVLLVTLDTTRADALGCYGANGNPTPVLDAIASEGTRFDAAIASAALTPVSHASILTGLENQEHGVRVVAGRGRSQVRVELP